MQRQPAVVDNHSRPEPFPKVIATVDLGSNSFHMIVAELRHGEFVIIDRTRETVRLAEGLSSSGDLSAAARSRALDCLSRFGASLQEMNTAGVRAAGTSALRRAREDSDFIARAESALGYPIDVISGIEEARLIFSGVTHSMPPNDGWRLVLDIGGGSTELILGLGSEPHAIESLQLGCVSMTERFFTDRRITQRAFEEARFAARHELGCVKGFTAMASDIESIGTSGTIHATVRVANQIGITDLPELTSDTLGQLVERVLAFDTLDDLFLEGLSERRAQVWPGGVAILVELFDVLHVDVLRLSEGALREGLLCELLGSLHYEDNIELSQVSPVA